MCVDLEAPAAVSFFDVEVPADVRRP
jgi:hypothetical protein